jgi:hypothetical protein
VRDEHRQDYDAGRGGWGAQAQFQMRAQREREAVYADAKDGPGAVAVGGGDWKEGSRSLYLPHQLLADITVDAQPAAPQPSRKRGRSPDDEGDDERLVSKRSTEAVQHLAYCQCRHQLYEMETMKTVVNFTCLHIVRPWTGFFLRPPVIGRHVGRLSC